jgi:hypothetical protein
MAFEVEEDDAYPRGHSNAIVTDEQGDCHHKGKVSLEHHQAVLLV